MRRRGRLSAALQGFMVHWVQGAVWPVLLVYVGGGGVVGGGRRFSVSSANMGVPPVLFLFEVFVYSS